MATAGRNNFKCGALVAALIGIFVAFAPQSLFSTELCPWLTAGKGIGLWRSTTGSGSLRTFTRAQLRDFDGTGPSSRIYLGMNGDVFDVTDLGGQFYGPGASYSVFAGRESTRALSLGSLEPRDINDWRIDDFTEAQMGSLKEQHEFYLGKYPKVGVIVGSPEDDAQLLSEAAAGAITSPNSQSV